MFDCENYESILLSKMKSRNQKFNLTSFARLDLSYILIFPNWNGFESFTGSHLRPVHLVIKL